MHTAELMAALNTVEEDHELVLRKVQALKQAVSGLLDLDHADVQAVVAQLRDSNAFFSTQFETHMQEEETTLFPLLERYATDGPGLVARLRQEHAELRHKLEAFGNCLQVAVEVEDELPRMVLRDLLTDGWALWEMLDQHAHTETRAVSECIAISMR
jgi:hemerythrin-like domain-containing protein